MATPTNQRTNRWLISAAITARAGERKPNRRTKRSRKPACIDVISYPLFASWTASFQRMIYINKVTISLNFSVLSAIYYYSSTYLRHTNLQIFTFLFSSSKHLMPLHWVAVLTRPVRWNCAIKVVFHWIFLSHVAYKEQQSLLPITYMLCVMSVQCGNIFRYFRVFSWDTNTCCRYVESKF